MVPQRDAQALAEKLEVLIVNPLLRKEMGFAGRKLYEEKFTIEIFEKRLLEIFRNLDLILFFNKLSELSLVNPINPILLNGLLFLKKNLLIKVLA